MALEGLFLTKTSIPWNNEPAPFGSLSAILLGTKKNFGGKNEFF